MDRLTGIWSESSDILGDRSHVTQVTSHNDLFLKCNQSSTSTAASYFTKMTQALGVLTSIRDTAAVEGQKYVDRCWTRGRDSSQNINRLDASFRKLFWWSGGDESEAKLSVCWMNTASSAAGCYDSTSDCDWLRIRTGHLSLNMKVILRLKSNLKCWGQWTLDVTRVMFSNGSSVDVASHTRKHWKPRHEDQPLQGRERSFQASILPVRITCITAVWNQSGARLVSFWISQPHMWGHIKQSSVCYQSLSLTERGRLRRKLQKLQNEIELKHETCARTGTHPGSRIRIMLFCVSDLMTGFNMKKQKINQ